MTTVWIGTEPGAIEAAIAAGIPVVVTTACRMKTG
jgi:hypothetical protein